MKLLTISLIISCNRSCYYCPVKKWLVPQDGAQEQGINLITNKTLLKWLDAYIDPGEWVIELTGGEPGLYPEIQTLIPELCARGYRGFIKTNGSLPIPKSKNFPLITAWHEGEDFPKYYDQILIIENPKDDWEGKIRYCVEKGIPYHTTIFDQRYEGKGLARPVDSDNKMLGVMHVNSSGKITGCLMKTPAKMGHDLFDLWPAIPFDELPEACPRCKPVNDAEKFLTPDLREKLERDYEAYKKEPEAMKELNRRLMELNTIEASARAVVDRSYSMRRIEKIAALVAVKGQPGWPVAVVWPE